MAYYHDLITQKSWEELQNLQKICDFILIGGWAVYLYTKKLKSKDIDIVTDFDQLPLISKHYELTKNERLQKYEARKEEVQIDIYLPHYSNIGIAVENLNKAVNLEGFEVLDINLLIALKIHTLTQRGRSPKGRKDLLDTISLLQKNNSNLMTVKKILSDNHLMTDLNILKIMLNETTKISELSLNQHHYSRLKKEILSRIDNKTCVY